MAPAPLPLGPSSIKFGTDGWRGVLGVDITVERLLPVAVAAAQELAHRAPADLQSRTVVIGGEESGGVGFGMHLPERDALFAAMLVLEALVEGGHPLGARLNELQLQNGGVSHYDRLDLRLADMSARKRLETRLEQSSPETVAGVPVMEVIRTDGIKLRLGPSHWLMLRFSGTEPLLRLYCEAPDDQRVCEVLAWAKRYAEST